MQTSGARSTSCNRAVNSRAVRAHNSAPAVSSGRDLSIRQDPDSTWKREHEFNPSWGYSNYFLSHELDLNPYQASGIQWNQNPQLGPTLLYSLGCTD
ncbi:hypothetical protein OIU77_024897 [Salix suchowensis]|uniref:Uncharacterized protein n=1 Tax=Salix suchowensis TaxID=1278906 RepID=A0ABQ9BUA2_9ROSI|nr:hypothetical protein OIU77_024897 [Salix suchowensis]